MTTKILAMAQLCAVVAMLAAIPATRAFSSFSTVQRLDGAVAARVQSVLFAQSKKSSNDDEEDLSPWEALADIAKSDDAVEDSTGKLGINFGGQLDPLSEKDAVELKAEAKQLIDEAVNAGLADIESTRQKMKRDLEKSKRAKDFASELEAQRMQEELQTKIDGMTGTFLSSTSATRESTKQAAAASRAMEGVGMEIGTWGVLNGRTVLADGTLAGQATLLGSVQNAVKQATAGSGTVSSDTDLGLEEAVSVVKENRIVIIADVKQDSMAKQLVPLLEKNFASVSKIPNLDIQVLSPTATMPIGANDADCVIVFCSSISQASSLKQIFDKLLRKTLGSSGSIGQPPTQLVGITTVGTERTEKFPYSMQNLMGGKLDQRRQVEEVLINTVKQRAVEPPLDYTLIKLGEIKDAKDATFELRPGDVLDATITAATAEQVIIQATAFQPTARNSTFSCAGCLPADMLSTGDDAQSFWSETFVPLEGPELWRLDLDGSYNVELYDQLSEYIREWALLLAQTGKGLTTPIQTIESVPPQRSAQTVAQQSGVQMLFLPTATGRNYMSKDEERERETLSKSGTSTAKSAASRRRIAKEGGITVLVEKTTSDSLRIRARRCNYADDTGTIKEISEETILKRLQDAMAVWQQDNA